MKLPGFVILLGSSVEVIMVLLVDRELARSKALHSLVKTAGLRGEGL